MAEIKILVQGYADLKNSKASSSVTLIEEGDIKIIVDPGIDRPKLLASLYENELDFADINFVILTHTHHLDHSALTGLFPQAQILNDTEIYTKDGQFSEHGGIIPDTNVKILKTPGHDPFHCSVLVNTEEYGKVVIAGDVFWWWEQEEVKTDRKSLLARHDFEVRDDQALQASQEKILKIADYIIPGHGKMFKVEK